METPAPVAFRLRDAYADTYAGGIINVDGNDFDVAAALDAHDGEIDTDVAADDLGVQPYILIDALDGYPALIRSDVDEPEPEPDDVPLDKLNKPELIERAQAAGINLDGLDTKADILAALTANPDATDGADTTGGDNA